jgi:hypothetical protein
VLYSDLDFTKLSLFSWAAPKIRIRTKVCRPYCFPQLVAASSEKTSQLTIKIKVLSFQYPVSVAFWILQIQDLEFSASPSKAMASKHTVHANQGQGETSYARNSSI